MPRESIEPELDLCKRQALLKHVEEIDFYNLSRPLRKAVPKARVSFRSQISEHPFPSAASMCRSLQPKYFGITCLGIILCTDLRGASLGGAKLDA